MTSTGQYGSQSAQIQGNLTLTSDPQPQPAFNYTIYTPQTVNMSSQAAVDAGVHAAFVSGLHTSLTIGAIVAHGVDALFSTKTGAGEGDEVALKKAELLLLWADTMGETASSGESLTIERLVRDALTVLATARVLTNEACAAVRLVDQQSRPARLLRGRPQVRQRRRPVEGVTGRLQRLRA